MIGNLCCLLVGFSLGGLLVYRWAIRLLDRPGALGHFIAGALRGCAHYCHRDLLHFIDREGVPVCISVNEVCRTLDNEISCWQRGELFPEPMQPPDGYA